jgi:hypothetical protein
VSMLIGCRSVRPLVKLISYIFSIVVAPAYYAFAYKGNRGAVQAFFQDVADASPLPVLLYNVHVATLLAR